LQIIIIILIRKENALKKQQKLKYKIRNIVVAALEAEYLK